MRTTVQKLLGYFKKRSDKARRRKVFRSTLRVESLEERRNMAGITIDNVGHLFIEGTNGNDTAYVAIDTHGDNNVGNDTIKVSLNHGGVTDAASFNLYKATANGYARQFDQIVFNGNGGSDSIVDFTNLDLNAFNNQNVSDAYMIGFSKGELDVTGTSKYDIVSVNDTMAGTQVTEVNAWGKLVAYKPHYQMTDKGVQPLITKVVFVGKDGDDYFMNSTSIDSDAYGGKGQDELWGGSGNDQLYGDREGPGYGEPLTGSNDRLYGRGGNDQLYGSQGDDVLDGGDGNDLLYGAEGKDILYGGIGNDTLNGDSGDDTLYGGDGDDQMSGGLGNDKMHGDKGNDTMSGDQGNDTIWGDDDWDDITDAFGNNVIFGGDGADFIIVGAMDGTADANVNIVWAGTGGDKVWNLGSVAYLHGEDGHDELRGAMGGKSYDYIYGEGGDDEIHAGTHGSYIDAGNGDDWVMGGDGNDTIKGGAGRDLLFGGLGSDNIDGGLGDDWIFGGKCNDNLAADHTKDTLSGGGGNDWFQLDSDGKGGDYDTITDFSPGDAKMAVIAWDPIWFDQVQYQKKGKPVS